MKLIYIPILAILYLHPVTVYCQDKNVPYKIDSIKAYLYYNENSGHENGNVAGTFSTNLIDDSSLALWNTIIGEGDAKGMSRQTFVIIKISGNPKTHTSREIALSVSGNNKIIFKQTQVFSIIDHHLTCYIPFLIYDTGCEELTFMAEIKNKQVTESKLIKQVHFKCGE